ncbi:hypothetical protein [Colwellia demingiae]|uniref:hypothetical protein n=1 Tax=Colwellia demingiae TaxID=89401 RepID=UPI00147854C1|nr:hypothetical protein [Colwellia demingiae]
MPTLAVMNGKLASSLFIATICQLHQLFAQTTETATTSSSKHKIPVEKIKCLGYNLD